MTIEEAVSGYLTRAGGDAAAALRLACVALESLTSAFDDLVSAGFAWRLPDFPVRQARPAPPAITDGEATA